MGIRFGVQEEHSFAANLAWAEKQAAVQVKSAANALEASQHVLSYLEALWSIEKDHLHIAVDVSSFPRTSLVAIYSAIWASARASRPISVSFLYSFAQFTEPPIDHGPITEFGAVSPEFSGIGEADFGLATLIGLGYESELALAAQQVMDPALTWLAVPQSLDVRFDDAVRKANDLLINIVDERNVWSFPVDDPYSTFVELEMISHGLQRTHNVVLVPLGPKLLVVACLLVSSIHRNVGVWRVSPGGLREPREQLAAGPVAYISAIFSGTH